MRKQTLLWIPVAVVFGGCATMSGSQPSTAPFAGQAQVDQRIKDLNAKASITDTCFKMKKGDKSPARVGAVEVTADAAGKLTGRPIEWHGTPAQESCVMSAIKTAQMPALPGPAVSTYWEFSSPDAPPPPRPNPDLAPKSAIQAEQARLAPEVQSCAQRELPPDFPADIEISFFVAPGGKVVVPNVSESTSNDGSFDTCVMQVVGSAAFPDVHFDGLFPLRLRFHVGRSNNA